MGAPDVLAKVMGMKLQINDNWRIVAGERSWNVQRYRGVYGSGRRMNQPRWESEKYCSTLAKACSRAAEMMIMESQTETPTEALRAIERVSVAIDAAIMAAAESANSLLRELPPQLKAQ